jgi:hypothetical protein
MDHYGDGKLRTGLPMLRYVFLIKDTDDNYNGTSIYLSIICVSMCLSIYLSISIYLSVCLYPSIYLSIR